MKKASKLAGFSSSYEKFKKIGGELNIVSPLASPYIVQLYF